MKSPAIPFRSGFVLIEVMLGVLIFAIGVIALGKCVNNCLTTESVRQETERARLALENRMDEIEAGVVPTDKSMAGPVGDSFPGMKMIQTRKPVVAKNEKGDVIQGLFQVDLEVDWTSAKQPQARKLSFYVLRSQ
jgi:Tfp pilus assembly protein PilV